MSYCTAADVKVYVGTVVSDADLTAMISDSDGEISAYFLARGGITPVSTVSKQVSIMLTRARIAERFQLTGENPAGYSAGDYSQSGSADQLGQAKMLRDAAEKLMKDEVGRLSSNYTEAADITRSDANMEDFKLDQSDPPTYFTELT